jgi:hypothetical protein
MAQGGYIMQFFFLQFYLSFLNSLSCNYMLLFSISFAENFKERKDEKISL